MRIFAYCRVSTEEQARSGNSLDAQRTQVGAWATLKGWTIAESFVEEGVSGSIPLIDRPAGKRLLSVVRKGDIIITSKLDRMFRSAADALATLEELKALGVSLHMIDMGGDVTGNGISKMLFTILAAVAEGERDRLRERIREGKRALTVKGGYNGGKRPFGFNVVAGRLVPNEAELDKLARMRAQRDAKATYRQIGAQFGMDPKSVKRILDRPAAEYARLVGDARGQ